MEIQPTLIWHMHKKNVLKWIAFFILLRKQSHLNIFKFMNQILYCVIGGYVFKEDFMFIVFHYFLCVLWAIYLSSGTNSEDSWLYAIE